MISGLGYKGLGVDRLGTVADQLVEVVVGSHVFEQVLLTPAGDHETREVRSPKPEIRDDRRLMAVFCADDDSTPRALSTDPCSVFGHVEADTPALEAGFPSREGAAGQIRLTPLADDESDALGIE
jgi:hypothetical protein